MEPSSQSDLDFHAPSLEELQPLFPAYEIGGFIAQGGMGAVYAASQKSLDRPVAIKILPRQFAEDPQFRSAFEAEAKAMARLNHPNLIGVYDFGEVDGFLFIIMELVEGKSLFHSAHGKAIEQKEAARIVAAICDGLTSAHTHGILHRDIKPANILLGPGAIPKIGDFGLARPVGARHNPEEIVFGTPGYSAPEVINRPEAVDQRADIFSVGVLLYELLVGKIPGDPYQPPSQAGHCDPGFDSIVRRATHPSPGMRYGDTDEFAKDLNSLVTKLEGTVLRRSTGPVTIQATPPATTAPLRPVISTSKSKTGPVLIVLLLLAIVAVGALILSSSRKDDPPANTPEPNPLEEVRTPTKPKPKPDKTEPPVAHDKPDKPRTPKKPSKPDKPTPAPPKPEPVESTTEALARLQGKLKGGDRSEFPAGTTKHGDSHFLLIDQPLSWHHATRFAEHHGAHLAVLENAADLAWATETFKVKAPVWLGLSDSGTEAKWFWVNGTTPAKELWAPGQPDNSPSKDDGEDFAALLPGGILDDLPASRDLSFLLQWPAEGADKGSLASQLKRTGAALRAKRSPIFPAGTRNIGGSRFLLLPYTKSWDEASALATSVGGHLAVPSSPDEAAWILDTTRKLLAAGQSAWIGGRQIESTWRFVTGERFEFIEWAAGQPDVKDHPQPCLQLWRSPEEGGAFGYGNSSASNDTTAYLILEWSAPSRRNMPTEEELKQPNTPEAWLEALREKTHDTHKVEYERFKRRWDKNIDDFIDDINSEADTARRFAKEAKDYVDAATKTIRENGRIPEELGNPIVERWIGDIHERAIKKQNALWEDFQPTFNQALDDYLNAVKEQVARLLTLGDPKGSDYLDREHDATSKDHDRFHAILRGEFPPVPDPEAPGEEGDEAKEDGENGEQD